MKNNFLLLAMLLISFACQKEQFGNPSVHKPGESTRCIGGGCGMTFTITAEGRGKPSDLPPPSAGLGGLGDWLKKYISPSTDANRPMDDIGNGGRDNSVSSQPSLPSSGGDTTDNVSPGETAPRGPPALEGPDAIRPPPPGRGVGESSDKKADNKDPNQETKKATYFEDSDVGKAFTKIYNSGKGVLGEINGSNNKKRREAKEAKQKINELKSIQQQVTAAIDDINSSSQTIFGLAKDLTDNSKFDQTTDIAKQMTGLAASHNSRVGKIAEEVNDIPDAIEIPAPKPIYDTPQLKSIEQARAYRNYVWRAIEAGPEDTKEPRRKLLSVADQSLAYSEAAYRSGNNDGGDRAREIGIKVLDLAISAAPLALWIVAPQAGAIIATAAMISWAKDYYEAQTGRGFLTGEPVQGFYRGMAILGAAMIPFGGAAKGSVTIAKDIELLGDIWKFEKTAEETAVIAKNVEMAEEILDSAKNFLAAARRAGSNSLDERSFLKRTVELADDTVESGSIRLKQGVGGARYEVKNGVKLRTAKTGEEGIDFVNVSSGEKISLKGPYRQNNMDPIPPQAYNPETFAKSALKPNTAVDKVVIDLYGFNEAEKELIKNTIKNGNPTKPVEYLE